MAPVGTCIVCEQIKVGKKYRTVTIEGKRKAEKGGYLGLEVGGLICSDCYNLKIKYDRGTTHPKYPMIKDKSFKRKKSFENIKIPDHIPTAFSVEELQGQISELKRELESATRPSSEEITGK